LRWRICFRALRTAEIANVLNGLNLEVMSQQAMRFRSGHCRQADQISHDVRFWHKADITIVNDVRFRG
jgi:hypothetical protein